MEKKVIGHGYEVLERLGSGSYGTVWKAVGVRTGRVYAVKQIDLAFLSEKVGRP